MGRMARDDEMTMRIVTILFSLSCLALRAQCAPFSVRCLILAAMTRAEAVARVYALGAGVSALAPVRSPYDRAEPSVVANLALRLWMIALTLLVAVARNARSGMPAIDMNSRLPVAPDNTADALSVQAPSWPDTS